MRIIRLLLCLVVVLFCGAVLSAQSPRFCRYDENGNKLCYTEAELNQTNVQITQNNYVAAPSVQRRENTIVQNVSIGYNGRRPTIGYNAQIVNSNVRVSGDLDYAPYVNVEPSIYSSGGYYGRGMIYNDPYYNNYPRRGYGRYGSHYRGGWNDPYAIRGGRFGDYGNSRNYGNRYYRNNRGYNNDCNSRRNNRRSRY